MRYKDLKSKQITKDNQTDHDVEAIKNSIKNILMTRLGSLPGKPNFGSRLHLLVFEQLDHVTNQLAKRYAMESLARHEDRIKVLDVIASKDEAFNRLIINIVFSYRDDLGKTQTNKTAIPFNL